MQAAERAGRQETRTDDRDAQLARVRAAFARVNNVRVCHVHAPAEDPTRRVASRTSVSVSIGVVCFVLYSPGGPKGDGPLYPFRTVSR